jgi:hypothetical protein
VSLLLKVQDSSLVCKVTKYRFEWCLAISSNNQKTVKASLPRISIFFCKFANTSLNPKRWNVVYTEPKFDLNLILRILKFGILRVSLEGWFTGTLLFEPLGVVFMAWNWFHRVSHGQFTNRSDVRFILGWKSYNKISLNFSLGVL